MRSTDVRWFRISAITEAISWTGLLIGMVFKYLVVHNAIGVHIFGSVHGVVFLAYLWLAVRLWRRQPWPTGVGVWAIVGGIVPFGSVVFERWATRTGRLVQARTGAAELRPSTGTA
jgi:integral membrane protein